MTNRYHLPVVITTADEITKEEATNYVERTLANLEEADTIYRTFVEDSGIDDTEAARLLAMLEHITSDDIQSGVDIIGEMERDDEE